MDGQEFSFAEAGQDLDPDQWLMDLQGDLNGSSLFNAADAPDAIGLPDPGTVQGSERVPSFDFDQFLDSELDTSQTQIAQPHSQLFDVPQAEQQSTITFTESEEVTAKIVTAVGSENPQSSVDLRLPTSVTDQRIQDAVNAPASEDYYTLDSTFPYQLPCQIDNSDASLLAELDPSIADADLFTNYITQRLPPFPAQTQWSVVDTCQTVPRPATGQALNPYEVTASSQPDLHWPQETPIYGMAYPEVDDSQVGQTPDLTGALPSLSSYPPFWTDGSLATTALPPAPGLEPYPSGRPLISQVTRDTSVSSTGSRSLTGRGRSRTSYTGRFTAQKPKVNAKTPWVRVNTTTEGKSTRSGKLNQYDPSKVYTLKEHPFGEWRTSAGHSFKYSSSGELSRPTYSTSRLREFLYEHPLRLAGLTLWIQRSPADSARRYPTPDSSRCRFEQCPAHQHRLNGNILHGHYRVAFDEKCSLYGEDTDPFLVAGYVHLYCLERFMDLPELCTLFNVQIDARVLTKEPNHRFAAAVEGPDAVVGKRFIELCQTGKLSDGYPWYPVHATHPDGFAKQHKHTLTYAMNKAKHKSRPPAQHKDFEKRGMLGSQISVHLGDLEMFCEAKAMLRKGNQAKRAREEEIEAQPTQTQELSQLSRNPQELRQQQARKLPSQQQSHELPESFLAPPMPKRRMTRPPEPQPLLPHAVNDPYSSSAREAWHQAYAAVQSTFLTDFQAINYSAAMIDNSINEIEEISPCSLPQRKRRRSAIVDPNAALEVPNKRAKHNDGASLLAPSESEHQSIHDTVETEFNHDAVQELTTSPDNMTTQTQSSQSVPTPEPSLSPPPPPSEQHQFIGIKDEPVDHALENQGFPDTTQDVCPLDSPNSLFGSPIPSPTDPQRTPSPDNRAGTPKNGFTSARHPPSPLLQDFPQDDQDIESLLGTAKAGNDQNEWADFEDMLKAGWS